MEEQVFETRTDLTELSNAVELVRQQIKKIIVGQDEMVKLIIAALLADGMITPPISVTSAIEGLKQIDAFHNIKQITVIYIVLAILLFLFFIV